MGEIIPLDKRGPDKSPTKAWDLCNTIKLLDGKLHVLQWQHRSGKEPLWGRLAQVGNPIVVRPRQRIGYIRVFDQRKTLCEPRGIEKRLVYTHGVHVTKSRRHVPSALVHRMTRL